MEERRRPSSAVGSRSGTVCETAYRVIYGDTDAGGVVYYGTYMRLLETGRSEYLRQVLGISYAELTEAGLIFPVVELHCRYHAPARYDDLLVISTWIEEITGATIRFSYAIKKEGPSPRPLLTGYTINAAVGLDGRPRRLPKELSLMIKRNLHLED